MKAPTTSLARHILRMQRVLSQQFFFVDIAFLREAQRVSFENTKRKVLLVRRWRPTGTCRQASNELEGKQTTRQT